MLIKEGKQTAFEPRRGEQGLTPPKDLVQDAHYRRTCPSLTREEVSPNGEHPVFAESRTGSAGGSNPTPGAFSSTPCVDSRYVQQIEPTALSEILNFGLWMRKQGYRHSTVRYCILSYGFAGLTNQRQVEVALPALRCIPSKGLSPHSWHIHTYLGYSLFPYVCVA
jgi:hypothetical protein